MGQFVALRETKKRKRTYQVLFSYLIDRLMELILHIQRRFAYGNQHR